MFFTVYENLCRQKGLSPNAVAKTLSISSGAVTEWKKGRVPQNATLKKIADFFNVSTEYLLSEEDNLKDVPFYERPEFWGDDETRKKHTVDSDAVLRYALFGHNSDDITPKILKDVRQFADFLRKQENENL